MIVGDPVISNLTLKFPRARGYPVQYEASAKLTSSKQGSADVVRRIQAQSTACPRQKFALVGYSQGAQVMHSAVRDLPANLLPRVVAGAMFGDPAAKGGLLGALVPKFPASLQPK